MATRFRILGVRFSLTFSSTSGRASFSRIGLLANTMPRSSRNARIWLIREVLRAMSRSRTRWRASQTASRTGLESTSHHGLVPVKVELVICLDRHEAHVLAIHGLSNRFSVDEIVLVRLHKRLHELGWNQLHIMALCP